MSDERQTQLLEQILEKLSSGAGGVGGRGAGLDLEGGTEGTDALTEAGKRAARAFQSLRKDVAVTEGQLEKFSEIQERLEAGVAGAGKEMENFIGTLREGGSKFNNAYNQMFKLTGAADSINRVVPTSKQEFATFGAQLVKSVKSGEIFISMAAKLYGTMINIAVATDKATASFRRFTGAAAGGNNANNQYAQVIGDVERQVAIFGGTHEQLGNQMGSLYGSYQNFTSLSKDQKDAVLAQTAALSALGVDAGLTAQIFDTSTKSLGFTDDQLMGLTETLHTTAQSLGKTTQQVTADFASISKQLAFYGTDVVDVFQELQKQSKATGLSMDQLVGIAGEAFDTFDGAATKVGRLNAILGGPYLNSIDMLNATEAERVEMIKASMDASGQMFSDLGKYEQKAIAAALGVDVDTARRMFGELSAAEEMQIRQQEKIAETAREAQAVMDKFKNAIYSLVVRMDFFVSIFAGAVELFSKFADNIPGPIKAIGNLIVLLTGLGFALKKAGGAVSSFGNGLRRASFATRRMTRSMPDLSKGMTSMGKSADSLGKKMTNLGQRSTDAGRGMFNAIRHPIQSFKALKNTVKNFKVSPRLTGLVTDIKDLAKGGKALTNFKMPSFNIPGAKQVGDFFRNLNLNAGKLRDIFKNIKMPKFGPLAGGLGKVAGGLAKVLYPLELAVHTVMSLKDNFSLFGDAVNNAGGIFEGGLGIIGSIFVTIGDAAARATDSLVNFGVFLVNLLLPKNFEIPKLDLAGMIQDSLANLDMGFITETLAYMKDSILGFFAGLLPDWAKKLLGIDLEPVGGGIITTPKNPAKANDIIVTSSGEVIQPHADDTIIATKPGGPILDNLKVQQQAALESPLADIGSVAAKVFSATPIGMLMSTLGGGEKSGDSGGEKTQPSNVNVDVNVKIGEKQLTDIIIEALASPEAGKAISPFLN